MSQHVKRNIKDIALLTAAMASSTYFGDEQSDILSPEYPIPTGISDVSKGVILAVSSSIFIGASFIIKKKGLRLSGLGGLRAGGFSD